MPLVQNYTFDPLNRIIVLIDETTVDPSLLGGITDLTLNKVLYSGIGKVIVQGNTVKLPTNSIPGGAKSTDQLGIWYGAESLPDPPDTSVQQNFKSLARSPELIITGSITRDSNGAATSASVTWPDGTSGTYTAITVSTSFPGAVDAYKITYGSTKTYTQPAITRDPSTGAVTAVPAIVVS